MNTGPGWPQTLYVADDALELQTLLLSISRKPRLQAFITTPRLVLPKLDRAASILLHKTTLIALHYRTNNKGEIR